MVGVFSVNTLAKVDLDLALKILIQCEWVLEVTILKFGEYIFVYFNI